MGPPQGSRGAVVRGDRDVPARILYFTEDDASGQGSGTPCDLRCGGLGVSAHNVSVRRVYESWGFRQTGKTSPQLRAGSPEVMKSLVSCPAHSPAPPLDRRLLCPLPLPRARQ
ncbi:hypothetical protein GCM10011374_25540 [Kocuria dechangensis]|uniref:Uncharacterized protein n=1 Tax=Kocuria dechangensis TaxID=1176249 RepID=A0A917GY86_9MICC|nr:hypothetical protein GCM10011374_25540 [Kocuria dechangensis]